MDIEVMTHDLTSVGLRDEPTTRVSAKEVTSLVVIPVMGKQSLMGRTSVVTLGTSKTWDTFRVVNFF